jgi:hypothetical protein
LTYYYNDILGASASSTRVDIIKPTSLNANLCLFYAILNGLETDAEKVAFCNNNKDLSPGSFIEFCKKQPKYPSNSKKGYSTPDVLQYLKFLVRRKVIKGFEYHQLKHKRGKSHFILEKLINYEIPKHHKRGNIYIVTGIPCSTDMRAKLTKALAKKTQLTNRAKAYSQLSQLSYVFNQSFAANNSHAFSFALRPRESEKEDMYDLFMFDSALQIAWRVTKKNVDTVVLKSLSIICLVKVLNIELF